MKSLSFCTIVTRDYIPQALTLYDSLKIYDGCFDFCILVSCYKKELNDNLLDILKKETVEFFYLDDFLEDDLARKIIQKYYRKDMDAFRWSMKSVFMIYLLQRRDYQKVIFCDSDVCFLGDYSFLVKYLEYYSILLTPHWRPTNPFFKFTECFEQNFQHGLFNGGFIAANKNGIKTLRWWAKACYFNCKIEPERGYYVDQKYLDLFILLNDKVYIIRHKGCNIANWNRQECKRVLKNEKVLINGVYPIIFIHFTNDTINDILSGKDPLLLPYLVKYSNMLSKRGFNKINNMENYIFRIIQIIQDCNKIAIFGNGISGKMCQEFISNYFKNKIFCVIDDNLEQKSEYPIITTKDFLENYQEKVDLVVFGKYQKLNPDLLPNLKIKYLRLNNIV